MPIYQLRFNDDTGHADLVEVQPADLIQEAYDAGMSLDEAVQFVIRSAIIVRDKPKPVPRASLRETLARRRAG